MDRGAWWATVHGVVKSQKWHSTHISFLINSDLSGGARPGLGAPFRGAVQCCSFDVGSRGSVFQKLSPGCTPLILNPSIDSHWETPNNYPAFPHLLTCFHLSFEESPPVLRTLGMWAAGGEHTCPGLCWTPWEATVAVEGELVAAGAPYTFHTVVLTSRVWGFRGSQYCQRQPRCDRWENWSSERFVNFARVTQPVSSDVKTQTPTFGYKVPAFGCAPLRILVEATGRLDFWRCSVVVFQSLSCVWLFVTLWIAALQASLSFTVS